jgi:hypothetical protein
LPFRDGDTEREAADGIVEAELLFGDELQDDAQNEGLRIAANAEMVGRH